MNFVHMKNLTGKKILIVVAYQDYQDTEYRIVTERLAMFGAELEVASSSIGSATGQQGGSLGVNIALADVDPYQYDALVFIGGAGSVEYQHNATALELVRQFVQSRKVIGAICLAPLILAKAGVLVGREATVWTGYENEEAKELESSGARFTGAAVTVDKRLVTANGPEAAIDFAEALAKEL